MGSVRIAMVAPTFVSALQAKVLGMVKAHLGPGEELQVLSITDDSNVQKGHLQRLLHNTKPTALIAVDVSPDESTVAAYKAAGAPVVVMDEEARGAATITTDNLRGGWLAGELLAGKGRKRVAVVSGQTQVKGGYNALQRVNGVKQALASHGLSIPAGCLIEVLHYSYKDGIESMAKLLNEKKAVDAVFCAAGDVCASGLLKEAQHRGTKVPADIAIVGFDDMDIAQIVSPSLTTVQQPLEEMSDAAYRMAVSERADTLVKSPRVVFPPRIIERMST
jgi:DNA-binding LacI/PurR family transcriptional regulator